MESVFKFAPNSIKLVYVCAPVGHFCAFLALVINETGTLSWGKLAKVAEDI